MAQAKKTVKGLKIAAAPEKGLWRAGRHWPHAAVTVALSELDKAQIEALRTEPRLVVVDADVETEAAE